jgi:hypothetical protein
MMKKGSGIKIVCMLAAALLWMSCEKTDTDEQSGTVRTHYDFEDVDYSESTTRLDLLLSITDEIRKTNTEGVSVEAQTLMDWFQDETSDAIDLADIYPIDTSEGAVSMPELFSILEDLSKNSSVPNTTGSGAGIVASEAGDTYLLDANGIELGELIRQRLLGGVLYYNALSYYVGENFMISSFSPNEAEKAAEILAMEQVVDKAFGLFGVPIDFPENKEGILFYGAESDKYDALTGANQEVMDALIKIRAGISEGDINTRNAGIFEVRAAWERILIATALHSVNQMKNNFDDRAVRNHHWTVVLGQMNNLSHNPGRIIVPNQSDSVYTFLRGNPDLIQTTDVDTVQWLLSRVYQLEDIKDDF